MVDGLHKFTFAIACLVFSMGINTEQNIPNILFKFDNNKS
jgi:hypothetical protein